MKSNNKFKFLLLGSLLLSVTLGNTFETKVEASETSAVQSLVSTTSGVSYMDESGFSKEIPIADYSTVNVSANVTTITINENNKTHTLKNVKEISFKNLTFANYASFTTNSVTNITMDGIDFKRGATFSRMQKLEALTINNSSFGAINSISFNIDSAPNLNSLSIDNSNFSGDLSIKSNKSLTDSTISNSVLNGNVVQQNNKTGHVIEYKNNSIKRNRLLKDINSGGTSTDDTFIFNPNTNPITNSKFDSSQPGKIFIDHSNGTSETVDIPASIPIIKMIESKNTVDITLKNKQKIKLTDIKNIYFRNVDIQTDVQFFNRCLNLEKAEFVNSNIRTIHIANMNSLKSVEINNVDMLQSQGFIRVRENKNLENFILQNSYIKGGGNTGYVMVYGSGVLDKFIMNNNHLSGYLFAKDLGTPLQLSNTLFDDYISTNVTIEGESGIQTIGKAPEIEGVSDFIHAKGTPIDFLKGITASDMEDGDLTSKISIDVSKLNTGSNGIYPVTYSVTDSDGNTISKTINITII